MNRIFIGMVVPVSVSEIHLTSGAAYLLPYFTQALVSAGWLENYNYSSRSSIFSQSLRSCSQHIFWKVNITSQMELSSCFLGFSNICYLMICFNLFPCLILLIKIRKYLLTFYCALDTDLCACFSNDRVSPCSWGTRTKHVNVEF